MTLTRASDTIGRVVEKDEPRPAVNTETDDRGRDGGPGGARMERAVRGWAFSLEAPLDPIASAEHIERSLTHRLFRGVGVHGARGH